MVRTDTKVKVTTADSQHRLLSADLSLSHTPLQMKSQGA